MIVRTPERLARSTENHQYAGPSDDGNEIHVNRTSHVQDMPSATGFICDFVPGKDGFSIQRNF